MSRTLTDIPLTDKDRLAIQRASTALREHFPIERIALFGSKARGEDEEDSDIDLLVLTSRPVDNWERTRFTSVVYPLQLEMDVLFSLLVLPAEEWDHGVYQALPIHDEIDRDGVEV